MKKRHSPGEVVPETGIYTVNHKSHRLIHEATLIHGDRFPICRQCGREVRFELHRGVKRPDRTIGSHHAILEDYPDVSFRAS